MSEKVPVVLRDLQNKFFSKSKRPILFFLSEPAQMPLQYIFNILPMSDSEQYVRDTLVRMHAPL